MTTAYRQESDPIEVQPTGSNDGERSEVGMRISPEVVLFVGGVVLTVALFAVFIPFFMRIWREDAASRGRRVSRTSDAPSIKQDGSDTP